YWLPGVLSKKQLEFLYDNHFIRGIDNFKKTTDYSSIDLHLSDEGWEMNRGSIKPFGGDYMSFLDNPNLATKLNPEVGGGFHLEKNRCYVFKLKESVVPGELAKLDIIGQATAKSTIGRLDVIARLIVDGMREYDKLNPEEIKGTTRGDLFLEIVPISFNIRVKKDISLSQLRFFKGDPDDALIRDKDFIKAILKGSTDGEGFLSVNLRDESITGGLTCAAFRARHETDVIDAWKKDPKDRPNPCDFWRCDITGGTERLEIEKDQFYILRSLERIALPSGVAVYARAMDETLGEMRIHYAGFAHPYFGFDTEKEEQRGTPLIFEVRGHSVNVSLNHGERLAKLNFYRMSDEDEYEKPEDRSEDEAEDDYNKQELKLSNIFRRWPAQCQVDDCGRILEEHLRNEEGA
ncbi:MAG: 2'-deoxycytidine 5'-triphosphate deaminase, partial [Deltaproteobacteria bacterium]|nr:2'-deoxycytidine 5'-triphosphate deaminase [Deltaproteobacteria bacterium]